MWNNKNEALISLAGDKEICLVPSMANRHGLITGATGTGKTVTLQSLAETFSAMGVPVFASDVKGDLSGVAAQGGGNAHVQKRVEEYKLDQSGFVYQTFPVQFWDLYGEQGLPVRASMSDMGAMLLSRLMDLNDTQSDVLTVIFKIAQDESLEIVNMQDLQKMLEYVRTNSKKYSQTYGNIASASLGAIQRGLISLESSGADQFFGEPGLDINDLIQVRDGKGVINILAADKLMNSATLYSSFLLWLLNKLFSCLPEVGDMDKPKLVFFFDEAHLLFNDAPKALTATIEKVVRLIRSKGVGVYVITQTPADVPDSVLGQLGNRVQHALHAYTPRDQKAIEIAAKTFRANPAFSTQEAISQLGVGEALVSFLDAKGTPQQVERGLIVPPEGQVGALDQATRRSLINGSLLYSRYEKVINRVSAFEKLTQQHNDTARSEQDSVSIPQQDPPADTASKPLTAAQQRAEAKAAQQAAKERQRMITRIFTALLPILRQLLMAFMRSNGGSSSGRARRRS